MSELDEVVQQFRKGLEKELKQQRDYVADGKAKDYNEYSRRVGQTNGLIQALKIFNDALKRGEQEDDQQ